MTNLSVSSSQDEADAAPGAGGKGWFSPLGRLPLTTDRVRTSGAVRERPGFFAHLGQALTDRQDTKDRRPSDLYPWLLSPALLAVDRGKVLVHQTGQGLEPLDLAQVFDLHAEAVLDYTARDRHQHPTLIFAGSRVVASAPGQKGETTEQPVLVILADFARFLDLGDAPLNLQGFENQEQTLAEVVAARSGGEWVSIRDYATYAYEGQGSAFAWGEVLAAAASLSAWHASSGFDARTGAPIFATRGGWVRVTEEGRELFPRTDPAVITAVTADVGGESKVLLGQARAWGKGRFSTFAGFVEGGEALETAVLREVYEECGGLVVSLKYLGSQPWPFPRSLMCGYLAEISNPDQVEADGAEIEEIRWFSRSELLDAHRSGAVQLPGPSSISRRLIEFWLGQPLGPAGRVD
ncbi:NAD(+) diphosphatase [Rothia nasimurium]|uniref:NAD(+) diphosphatase n=2 Tax=Rothia nasimurium TaxID=85336 RepID=A0A4Y9F4U4_9MICC|nr:NAD(+) diphosphatase [Rothia nasimurium]TFU23272.1 NAD(+) diphosphatase [Rothia nasimurium]